jgi:alpha-beta hydrolase superfamily lysophospholipase
MKSSRAESLGFMSNDEAAKQVAAFRRAMPVSRMLDYGMAAEDAKRAHRIVEEGAPWDEALEAIAEAAIEVACKASSAAAQADAWRQAGAALIFAQMAFNFDTERKRFLYLRMNACIREFAERAPMPIDKVELPYREGKLFGWRCRPIAKARGPTVIVFGGMSGWSTAYFGLAEALCEQNVSCFLVDGPGQGDSRLEGSIYLDANVANGFARFVDLALDDTSGAPVGLWGNSFGGLFAALSAAADARVKACCINGAPAKCEEPPFRTAAEQMAAMFGRDDLSGVGDAMRALAFNQDATPLTCPVLILEGGADPLVPLASQSIFRSGNKDRRSRTLTWADGEHTIYNHAAERNAAVAHWFAEVLAP